MLVIASSWLADGHLPTVGVILAVLGIGCGTRALRSLLQHVGSLVAVLKLLAVVFLLFHPLRPWTLLW